MTPDDPHPAGPLQVLQAQHMRRDGHAEADEAHPDGHSFPVLPGAASRFTGAMAATYRAGARGLPAPKTIRRNCRTTLRNCP